MEYVCVKASIVFNLYYSNLLSLTDFKAGCQQFWWWVYPGRPSPLASKEPSTTVGKRASMFVCLCVLCACALKCLCVHVCTFVCAHVFLCVCVCVLLQLCFVCVSVCMCVYACMWACMYVCACVCRYYATVSIHPVEAIPWLWLLTRLGPHLNDLLNWQSIGASLVFSLILMSNNSQQLLLQLKSFHFCYVIHTYYPWSYLMVPLCSSPL